MIIDVKTNNVNINKDYEIVIEKNLLDNIEEYINFPNNTLIVTDTNIPQEYIEKIIKKANKSFVYKIIPGESSKTIVTYQAIMELLLENKFTRNDLIIALGGGVVGDLTGFVAATYKRGIDFINIPTSTLSMIDSSIGGKVAVNFNDIKNVVGAFYMPKKVLISLDTLNSLPIRHYNNGLMEALKAGLIYDKELYNLFKNNKIDEIENIIVRSLNVKKQVVETDPLEKGLRKILNFGHTIGHAIESENFDSIFHGEAIAYGMLYFLNSNLKVEVKSIIENIIGKIDYKLDIEGAMNLIANDKKCSARGVSIVRVDEIGKAKIINYTLEELRSVLDGGL